MSKMNGVTSVDITNSYGMNTTGTTSVGNTTFSSYLETSKSMDEIFAKAAAKYNVPVDLLKAIGKAESDFNPNAVSKAGAQGVMQLMPATAKELGVTDSFDAEQNIMGGAKYISGMLRKYNGDTKLALAAYNAGSGNVKKYGGIPPFKETQNYVKKVMKYFGEGNMQITSYDNGTASNTVSNTKVASSLPYAQKNLAFLLVQGVNAVSNEVDSLDALFSYEDYLKFIDIFLSEDEEEKDNIYNNTKELSYNAPILNLLREQGQIGL